ncbi:prophage P1 protein 55 [Lactiplantibacillus plantarum]|nr:prophage P1 protein 55 [Lactiplantibacillus plantarum]
MSIKELQDATGTVIHPMTEMAAIADADKLVNTTSTQNNIAGIKNFVDGISIKGVPLSNINFGKINSVPNDNIYEINQSGLYYYYSKTTNRPLMDISYLNGYIVASFKDINNGILLFIGGLTTMEKFQGEWRKAETNTAMDLWSGGAKVGDTLKLAADVNNFDRLRFKLTTPLGNDYVERSTNKSTFWLTQVGLSGDGGAIRAAELTLDRMDDQKAMKLSKALINNGSSKADNLSDVVLTKIEGLK